MDLSIIIINWNSLNYTRQCLRSLQASDLRLTHEILVADGGSFDGSDAMIASEFPGVRFIQIKDNVGFAAANNIAAKQAQGELVLFLNPDTEVEKGSIDRLVETFRTLTKPGVVGCQLLNTDGTLQTSCVQSYPTLLNQMLNSDFLRDLFPNSHLWGMEALFNRKEAPQGVEAVSGACMLAHREVFESVKGFSEDYFMYAEDIDLCLKLSRAGFVNYYAPHVKIVHHGGGSSQTAASKFSCVMMVEATFRFLKKFQTARYAFGFRMLMFAKAAIRVLVLAIAIPFAAIAGRAAAVKGSLAKWYYILKWGLGLESWTDKLRPKRNSA
ncbi:MAG: glycosyltransferase family 2 protein [Verrucomicrobia bacterium]|nr:glycosyltransferase family 2 protein [Verrucomicrobiota bacterium]MBI3869524.1 glycosyltransferase family 2 protein [Verrucomicrobiota bacterium]